jgi:Mg-chelatase subunit ChlI
VSPAIALDFSGGRATGAARRLCENDAVQTGRSVFPFTAIVGQEPMKQALILNAINPAIGGVLIRGEKGTAKSTAVRALARLLPELAVVADCRFGCPPLPAAQRCFECEERLERGEVLPRATRQMRVVELPINASEDRVVGSIDIEAAIKKGEKEFEPGVLAEANRNILYVDEVNLLDDHIVDVLLDAAAMGTNTVEREGVSVSHPARFILVGTMNPEEGELRPQLLDRFGLCVDVEGIHDVRQRVEIVERREAFEEDPEAFVRAWAPQEHAEAERIRRAIVSLADVAVGREILVAIAHLGIELEVDGHRSDLVNRKAAQAVAAHEGRDRVTLEDVERVAPMVLAHRVKPQAAAARRGTDIGDILRASAASNGDHRR